MTDTPANTAALEKLSSEQLAALSDELKAAFCTLTESDQKFFASAFKPADLPVTLSRKMALVKSKEATREQYQRNLETFKSSSASAPLPDEKGDEMVTSVLAGLGIGAAAVAGATGNTEFFQGVKTSDLVAPLRAEFHNNATRLSVSDTGSESLLATISLLTENEAVPAMTINLTRINDGTEVKVNDLSTRSVIETVKSGGEQLLKMAQQGLNLLNPRRGGLSAENILSSASPAMQTFAELAEQVGNLKLKDRAWKVMRSTAESLEAQYKAEQQALREQRERLEKAWDNYFNCPGCAVPFGADETNCHVCGTARPDKPLKADPRQEH